MSSLSFFIAKSVWRCRCQSRNIILTVSSVECGFCWSGAGELYFCGHTGELTCLYRHSPTYAVDTFRKARHKSSFVQGGIEYIWSAVCIEYKGAQLKSSLQHTGSMTTLLPVLSPSSILPPLSSRCAFPPTRTNSVYVLKVLLFQFLSILFKLRKSEIALVGECL